MKRRFPYKILLSACLSAALVLGPAAYAYASSNGGITGEEA